jgi:hypothetical protein
MLGYDAILIIRLIQNYRASNPTYLLGFCFVICLAVETAATQAKPAVAAG